MEKTTSNKKNMTLEYIRALSTIAVVSIHTVNSGIIYSGDDALHALVAFFLAIKNIIYWAVPCFLMITGYLLLNPEKSVPIKKLFGKYILRMVLVLATFGAAFSWIEIFFDEKYFAPVQILQTYGNILTGNTWAHLWYVYTLIGLYLFLPLYRAVAKCASDKELLYLVAVIFFFQTVLPVFEHFTGYALGFSVHIAAVFPLYLLLGEVRRRRIVSMERKTAWIVFSVSSLLIAVLSMFQVFADLDLSVLFGYSSPLTVIMAYALFCIFEYTTLPSGGVKEKIIREISLKSFAIYIIHMFFVNIEYQFLHLRLLDNIAASMLILVLIVVNLWVSYIVAWIMKKIPVLNKLL